MQIRHVTTPIHGRFLYEPRDPSRLLAGFHGYAEKADANLEQLRKIPGAEEWSLVAIEALHPFYIRGDSEIVANWMTRQDRELAIAENIEYLRRAIHSLPSPHRLVFLGFSQGAAMAWRAAADFGWRCHGIISLAGDVPPDVAQEHVQLPPALIARGDQDTWYSEEKLKKDLKFLQRVTNVTTCVFRGAHEWTDEFRAAAGAFLSRAVL